MAGGVSHKTRFAPITIFLIRNIETEFPKSRFQAKSPSDQDDSAWKRHSARRPGRLTHNPQLTTQNNDIS